MLYALQNSGITFSFLNNNVTPFWNILQSLKRKSISIGLVPYTNEITGLQDIDLNQKIFFYGSTKLVETVSKMSVFPGVFYNKKYFDPREWKNKREDLLNEEQIEIYAGDFKKDFEKIMNKPLFLKSVNPKVLTGMVLEGIQDKEWWFESYSSIPDNEVLILSPVQDIVQEWRFFILDTQVITGSQYKHDGILRTKEPISQDVWKIAQNMANQWMPNTNIVMDIARLKNGQFKVIEWNEICSSGFYNSDIKKFILALENKFCD